MKRKGLGPLLKEAPIPVRRKFTEAQPHVDNVSLVSPSRQRGGSFIVSEGPAISGGNESPSVHIPASALSSSSGGRHASVALRQRAIGILGSAPGRMKALAEFNNNVLKESSRKTKESKLETLQLFADAAHISLFPIDPEEFSVILGAMKLAGYKSADTYVSAARVKHIEMKHPMSDDLRHFLRGAERAMQRGVGPISRAPTINPVELANSSMPSDWRVQLHVAGGPRDAWASLVTALWWLLRGIETIELDLKNVANAVLKNTVELRLGATKTDIKGLGKRRVFACICGKGDLPDSFCPAFVMVHQFERRQQEGAQPDDPLFCTPLGSRVTSRGLTQVWAEMCSFVHRFDDVGDQSDRDVSEHTPRRSGTQFHIRRGLQLWQVQYIGRWGGNTVEIYAAEAFADARSGWAISVAQGAEASTSQSGCNLGAALWELKEEVNSLQSVAQEVGELRDAVSKLSGGKELCLLSDDQLVGFIEEARQDVDTFLPSCFKAAGFLDAGADVFVLNRASSKAHKVSLAALAQAPVSEWCSACGWNFGRREGVLKIGVPDENRCSKLACYKQEVMDSLASNADCIRWRSMIFQLVATLSSQEGFVSVHLILVCVRPDALGA